MQGTGSLLPFICIFFFCSFLSTSLFSQEDLHIIQSDGNGLLVEYTPEYDAPETFSINDSKVTRYTFNRYFNHSNQTIGTPEILMRSFTIRFPGLVGNTVEVVNIDYEEIPNVMLAPVPSYREGDAGLIPEYFFDDGAYNISEYLPVSVAALDHIGETRGIFLGSLIFTPLQYDAARKTIRKYNRIVARVNFGISESPTKSASKIKSTAINDDASQLVESGLSISKEAGLRSSVLSNGSWYRFNITEDGMYKLTGQALLNAGLPSSADPRTIGIYSNGGIEPPMNPQSPYVDDLTQNNILIFDLGTSGQLDANDYIIFYGKSTSGWNYNASTKAYSHYTNHYTDKTDYWLTYNNGENKLMTEVPSLSQTNPYRPTTVEARVFREDDKTNVFSSGIEWLGESFISGGQIVYRHQLPGLDVTQPIRYKFNLGAISDQSSYFSVYEHDSLLATAYVYGTSYEYQNYYNTTVTAPSDPNRLPNFSEEQSQLRIQYTTASSGGRGYLDWYEIIYKRLLKAQNDQFSFHTQDTSGVVEYNISYFSGGQVFVFDVTKFDDVQIITNPVINSDVCTFQLELTSGSVCEIFVVGQNGFKTPGVLSKVSNQNLHGDPNEAEYIIITHSDFMSAAQRLSEYRNKLSKQPLTTLVVDIDKIYNEFGGGTPTPVAVRNYLRYVYLNWTSPPKYVLLFGDGDFDYKRVLGSTTPNWIPPWESTESFNQLGTYASDDFYSIFFSGARVNIGVG
ncbi:MAG: hypothetical protein HY800_01745, partial [Ignavibacteriales bacterium]|nr:hypothetical protein [Ignavibacteriales bacterium]